MFATASADEALSLTFADASPRYAWIQDGFPSSMPKDPLLVKSPQIQLAIPSKTPDARAYVWDQTSGTIAFKKLSDVKDGAWDVKPSDFVSVAEVKVSIVHDGKPVASASVDLKDGSRSQSQLLDSSARGVLSFLVVKPGKIEISVKYRSNGSMATPVDQSFDLAPKSGTAPTYTIALPDPVETLTAGLAPAASTAGVSTGAETTAGVTTGGPAPSVSTPSTPGGPSVITPPAGPTPAPVTSSPIGSAVIVIAVLIAIGFVGVNLMKYAKKNPDKVVPVLEQLGVQIPKPASDDLSNGVPAVPLAAPAPPQPVQKIMLGDSSPDPLGGSVHQVPYPGSAFAGSAVATSPQLRSASGETIPILDVPMVVGRDPGLGLSLVGESTVSRRHAELVNHGGSVAVKDLGSTNGTFVNGARLQGEAELRPGDEVQFGAIRFRYEG